jgi:hypothetical protein
MLRLLGRIAAFALIFAGLWFLSQPRYASTETSSSEIRAWVLIGLGVLYFIAEHRLKLKADRRAERADAREIEFHRQRMDDRE